MQIRSLICFICAILAVYFAPGNANLGAGIFWNLLIFAGAHHLAQGTLDVLIALTWVIEKQDETK